MYHLTTLYDLTSEQVHEILARTEKLKASLRGGERPDVLRGHLVTQVFEKPSLRTRVSFDAAAAQLGAASLFLSCKEVGLSGRESLADVARVLSGYSDAVVLRTFSQKLIEDFAAHSACPVINGLSDDSHPCQALTDIFTMKEVFGDLNGRRLVFVGDGNNVAGSLAVLTAMLDLPMTVSTPPGYELSEAFLRELRRRIPTADLLQIADPLEAVQDADIVYTDVWASMGQESEKQHREKLFAHHQVNERLMEAAPDRCRFMHCLPARRGLEVTDDVVEGPQSVVFQQAENRLHLAKGLLVWMIENAGRSPATDGA